jgi:hypothetical protein
MVVVQEGHISLFKKIEYNNSKSTFHSNVHNSYHHGTPSMIAFKMQVVNVNLKYE